MRARVESEPGWIFSRRQDLALFGGTALVSIALMLVGYPLGLWSRPYPLWAWAATVLFVDVAHVWSTIFRVYLDGDEVRRKPTLYLGAPVLVYALGVAVYARFGHAGFWRALAYVAVWHFVRQQVGWVAIYQRIRSEISVWDARLDKLAVYAATVGPVLYWHANMPREFDWFVSGDFVRGALGARSGAIAEWTMFAILALWGARKLQRARRTRDQPGRRADRREHVRLLVRRDRPDQQRLELHRHQRAHPWNPVPRAALALREQPLRR